MTYLSLRRLAGFFVSLLASVQAYAQYHKHVGGIGSMADSILEPVGVFSSFVHAAIIVVGASLLFGSLIKYFEHKRSPLMVPLSTVIFMFILGVCAIALAIFSLYYH